MAQPASASWIPPVARGATRPRARRERGRRGPRWSVRLGELAGIDIYLHDTFLLLLAWMVLSHVVRGGDFPSLAGTLLVVAGLFGSVVLHELGHALVARRFGVRTRDITLWPIGGIARLERMPAEPRQELAVAVAGPAVNLVIAGALALVALLLRLPIGLEAVRLVGGALVAQLLWVNLSLALFNLLPAFPMDGGRVLRAALAMRMGRTRATDVAARLGQVMAVALGVAGLAVSPMLVLVAAFVWLGARQEAAQVRMQAALARISVGQAMIRDFRTLEARDPLARAVTLSLGGFQQDFPVVDGGELVGLLSRADVLRALAGGGSNGTVEQAMRREVEIADPGDPVDAILQRLETSESTAAVVVQGGRLVGMLTPESIAELLLVEDALRSARGAG